jgi:ribosomal protein S21
VEIARQVKKPIKSIDNALQRVKKKVEKHVINHKII